MQAGLVVVLDHLPVGLFGGAGAGRRGRLVHGRHGRAEAEHARVGRGAAAGAVHAAPAQPYRSLVTLHPGGGFRLAQAGRARRAARARRRSRRLLANNSRQDLNTRRAKAPRSPANEVPNGALILVPRFYCYKT